MFRKNIITRCPQCRSALNPRRFIGTVGLCDRCGWAGSRHSVNYADWVQLKVSFFIILAGLAASYSIVRLGRPVETRLKPMTTLVTNQTPAVGSPAHTRAGTAHRRRL